MTVGAQGVSLAGGGFVVTWGALASGVVTINGQLVDGAGQLVGDAFLIAPEPGWKSAIAALPSGGFVVTWSDNSLQVKAQIFNASAQPVGGPITVVEPGHVGPAWSVAALPNDAFVIGWRDSLGGSTVTQNVQMFDSEGHQVGTDLAYTSNFNIGDGQIAVIALADGRIVALPGQQQVLRAPTLGTSGDDTFLGTPDADRYMGLAGNDHISGAAANDELDGGDRADVIAGEGGDDTLYGGAGVDDLSGGTGNDTFYVDNAADVVAEAAGGGTDSVVAEVSYTLALGVEVGTLQAAEGTTAIDLTGNEYGNTLIGNAGANALDGLAGNEVPRPGAGQDTVHGGAGDDTIVIAAVSGPGKSSTAVPVSTRSRSAAARRSSARTPCRARSTPALPPARLTTGSSTTAPPVRCCSMPTATGPARRSSSPRLPGARHERERVPRDLGGAFPTCLDVRCPSLDTRAGAARRLLSEFDRAALNGRPGRKPDIARTRRWSLSITHARQPLPRASDGDACR